MASITICSRKPKYIFLQRIQRDDQKGHENMLNIAAAKSLQACPTLCDPIDGSPLGSSIPGILQARTLEWVAISFSNARKWEVKVKSLSHIWLFATPWTAAHQAPPSMGVSRQEYWSGWPVPSPSIREMQTKTTMRHYLSPVRMAVIKKSFKIF